MTSVISWVAFVAAPLACSPQSRDVDVITKEPPQRIVSRSPARKAAAAPTTPAQSAAAALYGYLTDGEDGCTCKSDLQDFTRTFQRARNAETLARDGSELLPTDGYLDPPTAEALATYSGHWLAPCYGAWNARCGAPLRVSPASMNRVTAPRTSRGETAGGCWSASLGDPGSTASCAELCVSGKADASSLADRRARSRAACGDASEPRLIHQWVYNEAGCPKPNRVAACSSADVDDPRVTRFEWFYEGSVAQVTDRCRASGRDLVTP
jgi:hypothetical protein